MDDLEVFRGIVGTGNVLTADQGDNLEPYNVDWMRNHRYIGGEVGVV